MLDITLITVGKLKNDYWQLASGEYIKRLKPYIRLKIEEIEAKSFSPSQKLNIKRLESKEILKRLGRFAGFKIYLLSEDGQSVDSLEFAKLIANNATPLVFVIGGSLGFDQEILKGYTKISLSNLTFTHDMARVILLEQFYRAISIDKGRNYHY